MPGHPEVERMPLARSADRRGQHLFPGQAAVARVGQLEGTDRARHVGRQRPGAGDPALLLVELARCERGRVPRPVNEKDAVLGGEIGDHEGVAPDARLVLLDHSRHVEDRRRGVEGVAAGPEHLLGGQSLQRMLRGDHGLGAENDRAPDRAVGRFLGSRGRRARG